MTRVPSLLGVGLLTGASLLPLSAQANDKAMLDLIKALHDQGTLTDQTYHKLRHTLLSDMRVAPPAAGNASTLASRPAKAPPTPLRVANKGRLAFSSGDGEFTAQIGGRVQADAAFYDSDKTRLGSGTELRRARLYMKGRMWRSWNYKLNYDFTGTGSSGIADAYLEYAGWKRAAFRVGHFKEPWSLEGMMSSNNLTFMERSLAEAFRPGRNIGIGAAGNGPGWTASVGLFGHGVGQVDTASPSVSEGFGVSGRATYTPVSAAGRILHFGASLSYRHADQNHQVRFSDRPESHITDVRLVDTGYIEADSFMLYDAEAAWVLGPFSLQGEYAGTRVYRQLPGKPDLSFDGYYLEGSWMLTGESRADAYDAKNGIFKGIKPNSILGEGGIGAWQVAARFSSVNLNDADIHGGREHNVTLGLNWYPTPNIRFMADYVKVLGVSGGAHNGDEPSVFQLRGQAVF